MQNSRGPRNRWLSRAVQLLVGMAAIALVAWIIRADRAWFERHVIQPNYVRKEPAWTWIPAVPRTIAAIGALALLSLIVPLGRWAGRQSLRSFGAACARGVAAVLFSLVVSEIALRRFDSNPELEARLGKPDPRTGWRFIPSRTTIVPVLRGNRQIHYTINAHGNRVGSLTDEEDPEKPAVLVTGESTAFGHGVEHEETIAALLASRLGAQAVNLAESGYGSDQAYLRLVDTLPRFRHPLLVVSTVVPIQLGRNIQDYRPRLALRQGQLELVSPATGFFAGLRLRKLVVNRLPFQSDQRLAESITLTAAILRETAARARERGAAALFVVPSIGPKRPLNAHPAAWMVEELLEKQRLPYVLVDIDPSDMLRYDGHPTAQGVRRMVDEIVRALPSELQARSTTRF